MTNHAKSAISIASFTMAVQRLISSYKNGNITLVVPSDSNIALFHLLPRSVTIVSKQPSIQDSSVVFHVRDSYLYTPESFITVLSIIQNQQIVVSLEEPNLQLPSTLVQAHQRYWSNAGITSPVYATRGALMKHDAELLNMHGWPLVEMIHKRSFLSPLPALASQFGSTMPIMIPWDTLESNCKHLI